MQIRPFILFLLCSGCARIAEPADAAPLSTDASVTDTPAPSTDGGDAAREWPRRATLTVVFDGPGVTMSDQLDLASGALVPFDAAGGDLQLMETKVISLHTRAPESICVKGTFASLGDVPTGIDSCSMGGWISGWVLGGSSLGSDQFVGSSMLVRDTNHSVIYRLRVASDLTDSTGTRMTVEYEPVP